MPCYCVQWLHVPHPHSAFFHLMYSTPSSNTFLATWGESGSKNDSYICRLCSKHRLLCAQGTAELRLESTRLALMAQQQVRWGGAASSTNFRKHLKVPQDDSQLLPELGHMRGVCVLPLGTGHPVEVALDHHGQVKVEGPPQLQEVAKGPAATREYTQQKRLRYCSLRSTYQAEIQYMQAT